MDRLFDPSTTAILVIDVQTGIFDDDPAPFDKDAVLDRIDRITSAARVAGIQVIYIQHDGDPSEDWLSPNTNEWRLHPALRVEASDRVIRKTACDAFYNTQLEEFLRSRSIETLVFTGYATDFCVDTTLRSAASKDFRVIVVPGAHTTKDRPVLKAEQILAHHEWMWANLICSKGVRVLSLTELLTHLKVAGAGAVSKS